MVCPKCGAPIPDNPTICESCGTRFQVLPEDDVRTSKEKSRRALILLLGITVVLIAAGVIVFFLLKNGQEADSGGESKITTESGPDQETVANPDDDDDDDDDDTEIEGGSALKGEYTAVAVEAYGQWMYADAFVVKEDRISIKIKQNGNATISIGDSSEKVKWRMDGSNILFTTKAGGNAAEKMGSKDSYFEWQDGVILYHSRLGTEDIMGTTMFAREDSDLSGFDIMTLDDPGPAEPAVGEPEAGEPEAGKQAAGEPEAGKQETGEP